MKQILFVVAGAFALAACGGGGGSSTSNIVAHGNVAYSPTNSNLSKPDAGINGKTYIQFNTSVNGEATYEGETIPINSEYTVTFYNDGTYKAEDVKGTWIRNDDGTFNLTEVEAGQVITETFKLNDKYTKQLDLTLFNKPTTIHATVDTTLLPEGIDIVKKGASYGTDFFITNIGTGTKDFYNYNVNYNEIEAVASNSQQVTDIKAAHASGWTGKGIDFALGHNSSQIYDLAIYASAPGANFFFTNTYNEDGYAVGRNNTNWYYEDNVYKTDYAGLAVGAALVMHKFDTLKADQAGEIVNKTADGTKVNIGKALSPVGHLN